MKNTDEIFQTIKKDGNDFKKYKMQETKINYDNYGPEEVFIRLVTEDKFKFDIIINGGAGSYRIPHDNSYTYVSDINEEDTENLYNNTNSIPQAKFIFYYKGKIFYSVSSINHVLAIEPKLDKITKYKPGFYGEYVCFLNLTPKKSDIAHKKFVYDVDLERLKKEPNEGGKKMIESAEKEIKKLEEELKAYQKN